MLIKQLTGWFEASQWTVRLCCGVLLWLVSFRCFYSCTSFCAVKSHPINPWNKVTIVTVKSVATVPTHFLPRAPCQACVTIMGTNYKTVFQLHRGLLLQWWRAAVNVSREAAGCSFRTLTADLSAPFAPKIILITVTRHLVQSRSCYGMLPSGSVQPLVVPKTNIFWQQCLVPELEI